MVFVLRIVRFTFVRYLSGAPALPVVVQPQRSKHHVYEGQTVFLQLTDHLPRRTFRRLVKRYNANHRVRSFTCWEQFLAMAFARLTYGENLRAGAVDVLPASVGSVD